MEKELIDMLERVLQEAITQDPFQGDDYELLHEAEALLAKAKAAEQSGAGDGLHSCLCGDRIPLDEYRCSNCRAWETTRA